VTAKERKTGIKMIELHLAFIFGTIVGGSCQTFKKFSDLLLSRCSLLRAAQRIALVFLHIGRGDAIDPRVSVVCAKSSESCLSALSIFKEAQTEAIPILTIILKWHAIELKALKALKLG
jgi:hypothetical protein